MSSVDLLYPELLSNEVLLRILQERRIKLDGIETMSRDKILELYRQYCLPLAQRRRDPHRSNNSIDSIEVNNNPRVDFRSSDDTRNRKTRLSTEINGDASKKIKLAAANESKRKIEAEHTGNSNQTKKLKTRITWP